MNRETGTNFQEQGQWSRVVETLGIKLISPTKKVWEAVVIAMVKITEHH